MESKSLFGLLVIASALFQVTVARPNPQFGAQYGGSSPAANAMAAANAASLGGGYPAYPSQNYYPDPNYGPAPAPWGGLGGGNAYSNAAQAQASATGGF